MLFPRLMTGANKSNSQLFIRRLRGTVYAQIFPLKMEQKLIKEKSYEQIA